MYYLVKDLYYEGLIIITYREKDIKAKMSNVSTRATVVDIIQQTGYTSFSKKCTYSFCDREVLDKDLDLTKLRNRVGISLL